MEKLEVFERVLTNPFSNKNYIEFTREFLNNVELVAPNRYIKEYSNFSFYVDGYYHIGNYISDDGDKIAIFSVCLKRGDTVERARGIQRNFVKPLIQTGECAGAIVAFFTLDRDYEKEWTQQNAPGTQVESDKWRLSFIRMDYEFSKGKVSEKLTPAKRYSYLVGKGEPCHTAKERLYPIFADDAAMPGIDDLEDAFSVESVTKEFFDLYRAKYHDLKEWLESNEDFMQEAEIRNFTSEQFAKKLLGQIVFLYFIQKKGWLGVDAIPMMMTEKAYKDAFFRRGSKSREIMPKVYSQQQDGTYRLVISELQKLSPEDEEFLAGIVKGKPWGSGPKNFMRLMFNGCVDADRNYFDDYLEPLFYTGLNKNRGENGFYAPLHRRIPFLNGGLFEPIDNYEWENNNFAIPNYIFSNANEKDRDADGILDIFDRYNFTMNEDEPMEREVAIDPEMLGKVFENLLDVKDRKSKGAFYTPREIVHYMCQETLINHIVTKTELPEQDIREFVLYGDLMRDEDTTKQAREGNKDLLISPNIYNPASGVNRLKEIDGVLENVKVADLAVGSGAFPLGMLNEIVKARETLSAYMSIGMNAFEKRSFYAFDRRPYNLKVNTIKNCIFACDIEPSAVDIAKLRLWLSIVIDDEIVENPGNSEFDEHTKPRQLPNLDCNIICGNSLIDEFKGMPLLSESDLLHNVSADSQMTIYQGGFDSLLSELIKLQDKLFFIKDHDEKEEIKNSIQDIYNRIIVEQLQGNTEVVEAYYDAINEPSQPFIIWQLYFPSVFRDNGGFDIVIGNPPWGAKLSKADKQILMQKYQEIDSSTPNSFSYFIGLGYRLSTGSINLVLPDSILIKDYAKTRKLISESIDEVIWYQNPGVPIDIRPFKTVDHDVCVIHIKKHRSSKKINVSTNRWDGKNYVRKEWQLPNKDVIYPQFEYSINLKIQQEDVPILHKLMQYSPLSTIAQCHEGIHTGNVRDKLFKKDNYEYCKPLFYGGGAGDIISTYYSQRSGWYVDYRKEIIDKSVGEYASLRDEKIFSLPKIYITRTGNPFKAFYDKECYASNNFFSLQMIDIEKNGENNLLMLLPFINSIVCQYFIRTFAAPRLGNTFIETKIFHLLKLPIPTLSEDTKELLVSKVRKLITEKKNDIKQDSTELEQELNQIVYESYGLTVEDIKIIETSVSR